MNPQLPVPEALNRRVTLRLWNDVPNLGQGLDANLDAGRKLWAKVEPVHGLAIRAGMQTGEVPTHLFWVRYTPATRPEDFTGSHVFDWMGRRYRVLDAINVNDMQRFTRVSVKELGPAT